MADPGDKVKVTTADSVVEGILMPNEESDSVVVKMSSGYNVGIDPKTVKKIDVVSKATTPTEKKGSVKVNPKLPTIAILHTGGTIASKVDYKTGGVISTFSPEEIVALMPELKDIANIKSVLVSNMMSEDMRLDNYQTIAKAIVDQIKDKVDGVIVGHGTDTLHVTSAALAFMFEELPIPVIMVGSQRSSDRGSSDAAMNLVCAAEFIANSDFAGVGVCMHENMEDNTCVVLPGTKVRKFHTSRRDAFKAVNAKPIARVDYKTKKVWFVDQDYSRKGGKVVLKDKLEEKVGILRTYCGMNRELIDVFTKKGYKGLILEGTGIGHAPTNVGKNLENYEALQDFMKKGGTVVLTSQCIFGAVHPFIYTNCRRLHNIGVIYGKDMLTDTAYVKLSWLLGNKMDVKLMSKNLRGEIKERLTTEYLDE